MKKCRECGAELKSPASTSAQFCGWACYVVWKNKKAKTAFGKRARCIVCGKVFRCGKKWQPACSKECRYALAQLKQASARDYKALPPDKPTKHPPGSLEKILVMRERVSRGQSPFHPDDDCSVIPPIPKKHSLTRLKRLALIAGAIIPELCDQAELHDAGEKDKQ